MIANPFGCVVGFWQKHAKVQPNTPLQGDAPGWTPRPAVGRGARPPPPPPPHPTPPPIVPSLNTAPNYLENPHILTSNNRIWENNYKLLEDRNHAIIRARLVQLHEQLHNFNSQTTNSLPNSLASFSENSLSQS
jgi:hypothetical protein